MASRNSIATLKQTAPDYRAAIRRVMQLAPTEENDLIKQLQKADTGPSRVASEDPPPYVTRRGYSEGTAERIRAYLASMRPLRGLDGLADDERYRRGRSAIERLARSATGSDWPTLRFTVSQCANITFFIAESEPLEPATWWQDPKNAPSHLCGFNMILSTVSDSLRASRGR